MVTILSWGFLYTLRTVQVIWWHGWIGLTAIILSIISAKWACKLLKETNIAKLSAGVFIVTLSSFLIGVGFGDDFGIPMYDLQPELYSMLTWLMPVERCIFSLFTTILAVPLIIGLPKIKIFAGPRYDETENRLDDVDKKMAQSIK